MELLPALLKNTYVNYEKESCNAAQNTYSYYNINNFIKYFIKYLHKNLMYDIKDT